MGNRKKPLLIYTSDNGGLVSESSGGRAKKGSIYEGGLRVPTIFEWPDQLDPGSVDVTASSSDFFPTLSAIAGCKTQEQLNLDGINLLPFLDGSKKQRKAIGFWHGYEAGQATWNDRVIRDLLIAKKNGESNPHPDRILKNVNEYPKRDLNQLTGHAAWNDWPWKLHRIQAGDKVNLELYNLTNDPMESQNLAQQNPELALKMKKNLSIGNVQYFRAGKLLITRFDNVPHSRSSSHFTHLYSIISNSPR